MVVVTRQPLNRCKRLSDQPKLEAILDELSDGIYGLLAKMRGLVYDTGRDAFHPIDRRASAAPAASATLARARFTRA